MIETLAAMKTAMRVLAALSEKHSPDAADVEELRRLAAAGPDVPLDELACDVIQRAIERRRTRRDLGGAD